MLLLINQINSFINSSQGRLLITSEKQVLAGETYIDEVHPPRPIEEYN